MNGKHNHFSIFDIKTLSVKRHGPDKNILKSAFDEVSSFRIMIKTIWSVLQLSWILVRMINFNMSDVVIAQMVKA